MTWKYSSSSPEKRQLNSLNGNKKSFSAAQGPVDESEKQTTTYHLLFYLVKNIMRLKSGGRIKFFRSSEKCSRFNKKRFRCFVYCNLMLLK